MIIPFGDIPLNQGEVLEITFTGNGSVFWNDNSDIFDQALGAAAFGWEGVLTLSEFETITVVTDSDGVQTATDAEGNAFDIADIPTDAEQVDCDGADDVMIVGGEVSIASECKQELADLIGDKILYPLGETCYLTDIDANSPYTREAIISNLDVERGPVFNQAGSNNMPWNNGPVFLMNGGDGAPVYESYELVSLKVFGDVGNVAAQPTQIRSNSATMTGSLVNPVVVGTDQLIEFSFDSGQIYTNLGTDGVGSLPMRLDPTLGSGQMGYTTRPIPVGNQMTSGGGTAGQEVYGELTILLQERQTVRVTSFVNKETGEVCYYQQDSAGAWSELMAIPDGWDLSLIHI